MLRAASAILSYAAAICLAPPHEPYTYARSARQRAPLLPDAAQARCDAAPVVAPRHGDMRVDERSCRCHMMRHAIAFDAATALILAPFTALRHADTDDTTRTANRTRHCFECRQGHNTTYANTVIRACR